MTEQPQMNGPGAGGEKYIDTIDPEDPEYIRQLRRPAEVKEDMNQMSERQRVSHVLKSQAFKEELEQLVFEQIKAGPHPSSLLALQQMSQLLLPGSKVGSSAFGRSGSVIPIADIRGVDSLNYTKGEKLLRCKLASLYRLADMLGWSAGLQSVISCRISQDFEHFLVIPYGVMYHEVTASELVKVDMRGDVIDPGSTNLGIHKPGFQMHAAIHASRPDIKTIVYLRNPTAVAISAMNSGILPISQEALSLGEIPTYDYSGSLPDQEERDKIGRALGPQNKVMILRNFGILVGGENIEEVFLLSQNAMTAMETQLQLLPAGLDKINFPRDEIKQQAAESARYVPPQKEGGRKYRRGEVEFEAYMRHLDNAGYRTGHLYREPMLRTDRKHERANSEVEIPPASTSMSAYWDEEKGEFLSPMKSQKDRRKKEQRTEWLNTPNTYKKEEIDEIGTANPKKITKWVPGDGDRTPPVKVENPNQFAPQGENPKEYKQKYQEIRKEYYTEKITAGPQSKILEGMTWEEAQRMQDGQMSGASDSVIVVGAASKGIIKRDHQHNQQMYRQQYAANPFDGMSDEDMAAYKAQLDKKGSQEDLVPGPDGKLISTEERIQQIKESQQQIEVSQQVYPRRQYLETSVDDIPESDNHKVDTRPVQETSIDDVSASSPTVKPPPGAFSYHQPQPATLQANAEPVAEEPQQQQQQPPTPPGDFQRSASERYPADTAPGKLQDFQRSKSDRKLKKPKKNKSGVNGEQLGSPTKSTASSGEGTLDERSSREGSPAKETAASGNESPEKKKDKKKKKFRMPSFSKKDKKEVEKKK